MSYRNDFNDVQREAYWSLPRVAAGALATMVVIYALGFLVTGGDLFIYKFWAPKQANAERLVFENTQSYVQGKVEYLTRLRYEYSTAQTETQKLALKQLILDEASTVDNTKLPLELQGFIQSLKGQL